LADMKQAKLRKASCEKTFVWVNWWYQCWDFIIAVIEEVNCTFMTYYQIYHFGSCIMQFQQCCDALREMDWASQK